MSLAATRSQARRVHDDLERGPTDSSQSVYGDLGHEMSSICRCDANRIWVSTRWQRETASGESLDRLRVFECLSWTFRQRTMRNRDAT